MKGTRQGGAIHRGDPQSTQGSLLIFESSSEDAASGKPSLTAQQDLSALSPGFSLLWPLLLSVYTFQTVSASLNGW